MRRNVIVAAVGVLALAGCTGKSGNPMPVSSAPSQPALSSTGDVPQSGVPKVGTPIDSARFQQTPCDTLTDAQAKELIGPSVVSKPDLQGPGGPSCTWVPDGASRPHLIVIYDKTSTKGIGGVYQAKGVQYQFVLPLQPIDGYPVVAYGVYDARNSEGICSVAVGTSDSQVIDIVLTQSPANVGKKDPCDVARQAAIRALATLRA